MRSNNNVALYQGLFIFRNTMLPFIVEQLQAAYGKGWWGAGVQRVLGEQTIEALEKQFERRYRKKLASVKRPGSEVYEMLDIAHFLPIIQGTWKQCFASSFEEQNRAKLEVWLGEIIEVRNAVMHPENEPLPDDDTWRAFDTMVRVAQLVDDEAANRILQVRQELETYEMETGRPLWLELKEGPYDYGQGIAQLQAVILQEEGQGSETHLKLERHRDQLTRFLWEKRLTPAVQDSQLENRIERVLEEFDRLAIHYLKTPFADLCVTLAAPAQPATPQGALTQIRELEREIEDLRNKLYQKEVKKVAQQQTGEAVSGLLEREIDQAQEELASKRKELARLMETGAPPTFFCVRRRLVPNDRRSWVEEQLISVSVHITNEGRDAAAIAYDEGLPQSFKLKNGGLQLQTTVESNETVTLSYDCYPTRIGTYQLSTARLEYPGRVSEWDRIDDTSIDVRPGSEPSLTATRYYRFKEGGLELLVNLRNEGDKIAHRVKYREEIIIAGQPNPVEMTWEGDILGCTEQTVEHLLDVLSPEEVCFPESVEITYCDSRGQTRSFVLEPGLRRIEYQFPVATDTKITAVGREAEIQVLSSAIDNIWQLSRGQAVPKLKRIVFIKGIEGTGKTKLVYELVDRAQQRGLTCYIEDAKDRSPVKRMLRRLLDLKPDEDNDEIIWRRLEEKLPGQAHSLRRRVVFGFISTTPTHLSEEELNLLEAHIVVLIKTVCQSVPTLLVFENIHWTPEGAEEQLLLALFHNVLVSREEPVLLCATYRPGEERTITDRLDLPRAYYELLELGAIRPEAVRAFVDSIVDFPHFSEPLHHFVAGWSGNPLYLIELLRLLTHPDARYLIRVGSEWYPAPGVRLGEAVPSTINDVILERVELELRDEADLVKTLSAIGFELPLKLVEALVAREFPQWSPGELYRHLEVLERAGILSSTSGESYEFEHQLKREVLYESIPELFQLRLRKQVAEILLAQQLFLDPDEQTRQLARHLVKSPHEFKLAHVQEIQQAAKLEQGLRNFSRSLDFYNAALALVPVQSFEKADFLIARSRLYQLRGDWLPADRDLEHAYSLVSPESALASAEAKRAKRLRILIQKEQGRVLLKQPQASLDRANNLLYRARIGFEGNLRHRRFFLPNDYDFHRDLVEIYLALAEVWLRKRSFKTCEKACRRAERIAKKAMNKWPGKPLLHEVYQTLGDLYLDQGSSEDARNWYELALRYAEHDRYQQERIWLRLADTYRALGNMAQALETYENAIRVQESLGDAHGLALSFGGIGDLYVEQGQFEQGRFYCEQAYKYQQLVSDLNRFWRTCVSLTKIHLKEGNWDRAAEYWLQARGVLFEQRRIDGLKRRKQQEIHELTRQFCEYFRKTEQWEKWRMCLHDLDNLLPLVRWERDELAGVQMMLGEACFKTRQWQEAIAAFGQAFELAEALAARAEALEWLGDVYAVYEPRTQSFALDTAMEEAQDRAERHYEEVVKLWVRIGNVQRALAAYDKLLNRIVTDEAGLLQLPFTFLRILRATPLPQVRDQFTKQATELLLKNELPAEAGDIVVYAAREVVRVHDSIIPLEDKLANLRQAEALYRQGKPEDIIWGLNNLIPSYFRLGLWDEIARCFEELFELNIQVEDADEFIETYQAIGTLRDRVSAEELERFTTLALSDYRQMYFSAEQRRRFFLQIAKHHSYIADRLEEAEEIRRYEDLSLEYYERLLQPSIEGTAMTATALNDSALIYEGRKEHGEALRRFGEAIRIHEQFGDYKGASEIRINRASLYTKMDEFDKAFSDYEQALTFLQRAGDQWNERLQYQDEHPLSPAEVIGMRYDKSWLAGACSSFSGFLLSRNQPRRAQELAQQAARLFREIGMEQAAEHSQTIASVATAMSGQAVPGVVVKRDWSCPSCGKPITEGMTQCPSCSQDVCPECGTALEEDAVACPKCGMQFDLMCPRCETTLRPQDEVCPNCGLSFANLCPQCGEPVDLECGLCPSCGQAVCPECGSAVDDDDAECPSCGAIFTLCCPRCGVEVSVEILVCPNCGEPFDAESN
jgi:tetratricopeptide (TPR) repeat protein